MKLNKVLVSGGKGTLGSAIIDHLKEKKIRHFYFSSKKVDMTNLKNLDLFFKKNKPTHVIHTANKVFGIGGNASNKFEMINENLIINSNLFKICKKYKVKKILCIGSSAVYSEKYKRRIKEKNIFRFDPHCSEFYYGLSKRIMLHQLISLNKQTGIKFCYVIMNNLYGIKDNFNVDTGHVIPSLIHKFYIAKKNNSVVKLWGNPKTKRSFLYTKDAAKIVLKLLDSKFSIINISSKQEVSIENLSKMISKIYNFNGKVQWQKKKHQGVSQRNLDTKLQNKLNINEYYSLEDGLKETISWFKKKYNSSQIRK